MKNQIKLIKAAYTVEVCNATGFKKTVVVKAANESEAYKQAFLDYTGY